MTGGGCTTFTAGNVRKAWQDDSQLDDEYYILTSTEDCASDRRQVYYLTD